MASSLRAQTWSQGAAPVWMPYFASSIGPVTVNNSLLLDTNVAIGVARSFVTPRDVRVLGTRDDNWVMSNAMALSVQSTASVACVGYHLLAKSHEVEVLRAQLVVELNLVEDCRGVIRSLKRERSKTAEVNRRQMEVLQEENQKLSNMVYFYSQDMRKQLEALERPGKCKQLDRDTSCAQAKSVIFGSSSDEAQEAVHENPRDDIQRAKLKAPMVETHSPVKK